MNRTITVKGTGLLRLRPDWVVLTLRLNTLNADYRLATQAIADLQAQLTSALSEVGFAPDDLKTAEFRVTTQHENIPGERGSYRSVFVGYACTHQLQLEFGFDNDRLSAVLDAIARSVVEPELRIRFTVKDTAAVNDALLRSAAENARARAESLASASGVRLGQLLSIDYSWGDSDYSSPTCYDAAPKAAALRAQITLTPEDLSLSDSATFVWELDA